MTVLVAAPAGDVPVVALTAPFDGAVVTAPMKIGGRVSGGEWKLEYRQGGEDSDAPWQTLATGSSEAVWSNLATFDPTMLLNGTYAIRLSSVTASGPSETLVHVSPGGVPVFSGSDSGSQPATDRSTTWQTGGGTDHTQRRPICGQRRRARR